MDVPAVKPAEKLDSDGFASMSRRSGSRWPSRVSTRFGMTCHRRFKQRSMRSPLAWLSTSRRSRSSPAVIAAALTYLNERGFYGPEALP